VLRREPATFRALKFVVPHFKWLQPRSPPPPGYSLRGFSPRSPPPVFWLLPRVPLRLAIPSIPIT